MRLELRRSGFEVSYDGSMEEDYIRRMLHLMLVKFPDTKITVFEHGVIIDGKKRKY